MRKAVLLSSLVFSFLAGGLFSVSIKSQDAAQPQPTSGALPSDPKALMRSAVKLNNLAGEGVEPWHIKASFQLFDEQGSVTDEGTYEEFWASPTQFKRTFIGKNFSETAYGSKAGPVLSGVRGDTPDLLLAARDNLVTPMPYFSTVIENTTYTAKTLDGGTLKLTCVTPSARLSPGPVDTSIYCFDQDEPLLRVATRPSTSDQTFHNRFLRFDDRAIAGELKIMHDGKPNVTLHIESASVIDPSEKIEFIAPPDAVTMVKRITIPSGSMHLLKGARPAYPDLAKNSGTSGTVVLQGVIGTDGHVLNLHVLTGPKMLQQSALDAVKQWIYRPYLLNGEPVEVMITLNVVFNIPNH
jgi:TonB family protein